MKFSILLPTHNRLHLLKYAIKSVLDQTYDNWELIISDNDSQENIGEYIQSLGESRIKYYRTDTYLNVTDNWNNTINNSTGDYMVMLGDDDALMPNCLKLIERAVNEYGNPEYIYTDAYLFCYPDVHPDYPSGYLQPFYDTYFKKPTPCLIEKDDAINLTRSFLQLNADFKTNMQLSIISRKLVERLKPKGDFFQSLFPDFYASITSFLFSERTLIYPYRLVVIGVSNKSHGYYFFNSHTDKAKKSLNKLFSTNMDSIKDYYIPGNWLLTGWLSSASTLEKNHKNEFSLYNIEVSYNEYRHILINEAIQSYISNRGFSTYDFFHTIQHMTYQEILNRIIPYLPKFIWERFLLNINIKKQSGNDKNTVLVSSNANEIWATVKYDNILDVVANVAEAPISEKIVT